MLVIVDIDGTLANCDHRLHFVEHGRKDWGAFFKHMGDDDVYQDIADLVYELYTSGSKIILVSGRPEDYQEVTEKWLERFSIPYNKLMMRKKGDFRADHIVKEEILNEITKLHGKPNLSIDDRESVIKNCWVKNGITTLRANSCKPSDIQTDANLYIMVGPSGAGKTQLCQDDDVLSQCFWVSSDNLREVVCKDFRNQTQNTKVFKAFHNIIRAALESGVDVVADATHLKNKDRLETVKCAPEGTTIHYVIVNRSLNDKKRDAGWRAEVPNLIERHEQMFKSNFKDMAAGDGRDETQIIFHIKK